MRTRDLQTKIENAVRCPVDWPEITGLPDYSHEWLLFDWYKCLMETSISVDEQAAITDMAEFGALTIDYDQHVLENINYRSNETKTLFASRSLRLSRLRFLRPSHNGKHVIPGLSRELILARSKSGPSLFFIDYTESEIRSAFWRWFLFFFDTSLSFHHFCGRELDIIEGDPEIFSIWDRFQASHFRVAVNCVDGVGAVQGAPSKFVCFDVSMDAGAVHAYPISELEAQRLMPGETLRFLRIF